MRLSLDLTDDADGNFSLDREALARELGDRITERLLGFEEVGVCLSCVTNEEMRRLNAQYRNMDEPTDVLSFPLWEEDGNFSPPRSWVKLPLGDVVVSPDFVRQNAERENIGYNDEMIRMIIHGVLHLVGFDHDTDERTGEMWGLQEEIHEKYLSHVKRQGGLMAE
jgi:probable rRNA maturation factor